MLINGSHLARMVRHMVRVNGNDKNCIATLRPAPDNNILVELHGNAIISATMPCIESSDLEASVLADVLVSTLINRKEVKLVKKGASLIAQAGRYKSSMAMKDAVDWPTFEEGSDLPTGLFHFLYDALDSLSMKNIVPQTPVLQLCCNIGKKSIMIGALDSVHSAIYISKCENDNPLQLSMALPEVSSVFDMLDEVDAINGVVAGSDVQPSRSMAAIGNHHVYIQSGYARMYLQLLQMPANFSRVVEMVKAFLQIPTQVATSDPVGSITLPIDRMLTLISNASAADPVDLITLTPVSSKAVKVDIKWQNGSVQDTLPARISGKPDSLSIGIQATADVLKSAKKGGKTATLNIHKLASKSSGSSQRGVFVSSKRGSAKIIHVVATAQR